MRCEEIELASLMRWVFFSELGCVTLILQLQNTESVESGALALGDVKRLQVLG
jgi:hypothetical protein